MLRHSILVLVLLALAAPAFADHRHDASEPPQVGAAPVEASSLQPRRLLIEVRGLVCSFCAYGVEKALGKIEGLDASEFGDGVLVDIDRQQVTLALLPSASLPLAEIHQGIKQAGYDPVRFHLRIDGRAQVGADGTHVVGVSPARVFEIRGDASALEDGSAVDVVVHLEADVAELLASDARIPVFLDASL